MVRTTAHSVRGAWPGNHESAIYAPLRTPTVRSWLELRAHRSLERGPVVCGMVGERDEGVGGCAGSSPPTGFARNRSVAHGPARLTMHGLVLRGRRVSVDRTARRRSGTAANPCPPPISRQRTPYG